MSFTKKLLTVFTLTLAIKALAGESTNEQVDLSLEVAHSLSTSVPLINRWDFFYTNRWDFSQPQQQKNFLSFLSQPLLEVNQKFNFTIENFNFYDFISLASAHPFPIVQSLSLHNFTVPSSFVTSLPIPLLYLSSYISHFFATHIYKSNIESLSISQNESTEIDYDFLKDLIEALNINHERTKDTLDTYKRFLRSLDISTWKIKDNGLYMFGKSRISETLTSLKISNICLTEEGVPFLGNFPNLIILDISFNDLTEKGFQTLFKLNLKLKNLDLSRLPIGSYGQVNGDKVLSLLNNSSLSQTLKVLKMNDLNITGEIESYKIFRKLKSLKLRGNKITDKGIKTIANLCPKVIFLNLASNNLSNEAFTFICTDEKLRNLIKLNLEKNPGILPESLTFLKNLPYLEKLNLSECTLTNGHIIRLAYSGLPPKLEKLNLSLNLLHTTEGFKNLIQSSPLLKELYIEQCWKEGNDFNEEIEQLKSLNSNLTIL